MKHFKTFKQNTGACGIRTSSTNLTMEILKVDCPDCLKKFENAGKTLDKMIEEKDQVPFVLKEDFDELLKIVYSMADRHADDSNADKRILKLAAKINSPDYGKTS